MEPGTTPLEIQFDAKEYHLSEWEEKLLREKTDVIARQADNFPVAELRILIQGSRSKDVSVKLSLILPGETLVVRDHDKVLEAAFDRCIPSLVHELDRYRDQLSRNSDIAKAEAGTRYQSPPSAAFDVQPLQQAINSGDYESFRKVMSPLESMLRNRVGRWVQRYPDIDQMIGGGLEIADIVEAVRLQAFESFHHRPANVPFDVWLDDLIDPAVKSFLQHPDDVLENVSMVRSATDAPEERFPT